ncbi:E3 ubiquitin-protein ligase RNF180-like [Cimex lectularius]|uniref:E3 ubiquitin-protein ligase RNF180 n=1 Tax=Cimex lectularius TaxID=79782 RepID=A0A8I6S924_CIMLE|nr:E3 ubiquitin-protein ligase RNF180-like [Cimex lectularius]
MEMTLKCKKCRINLIESQHGLLNGHNESADYSRINQPYLNEKCQDETFSAFYLPEDKYPQWVSDAVTDLNWVSGKLKCPGCSVTVGSVDFVAGRKCSCGSNILLPVKIIRSKVDPHLIKH